MVTTVPETDPTCNCCPADGVAVGITNSYPDGCATTSLLSVTNSLLQRVRGVIVVESSAASSECCLVIQL